MNIQRVISELEQRYPGKQIIKNEIDNKVTEILCEVEPTSDHPEWSRAIAIIDKSLPHRHRVTTETYKVLKGTLELYIENQVKVLKEEDTYIIEPKQKHWAKGKETWVEVYSEPGWEISDHIIE